MTDPIYLDYNATTPVAPDVLEAMQPWLREQHGNPLPNTLHVSFPGVSGRALLAAAADTVAASVGSACHSERDAVSGVLAAMGVDAARTVGAVRLSVGRMTTPEEIDRAIVSLLLARQRARVR